jgi:hypothetical protein
VAEDFKAQDAGLASGPVSGLWNFLTVSGSG